MTGDISVPCERANGHAIKNRSCCALFKGYYHTLQSAWSTVITVISNLDMELYRKILVHVYFKVFARLSVGRYHPCFVFLVMVKTFSVQVDAEYGAILELESCDDVTIGSTPRISYQNQYFPWRYRSTISHTLFCRNDKGFNYAGYFFLAPTEMTLIIETGDSHSQKTAFC